MAGRRSVAVLAAVLWAAVGWAAAGAAQAPAGEAEALQRLEQRRLSDDTAQAALELGRRWLRSDDRLAGAELVQEARELALARGLESTRREADDLLAAFHRLEVGPAAGQRRWRSARVLAGRSLELKKPVGVAARGNGELLVVDEGPDLVIRFDLAEGTETARPQPGAVRPFWGPHGEAGVTDRQGQVRVLWDGSGSPLKPPAAGSWLDFQWDDGGWLALSEGAQIVRLDADGGEVDRRRAPASEPVALAADPLGNLYLLDELGDRVVVADPLGKALETLGPRLPGGLELRRPRDVTVDGRGRVYIADRRLGVVVLE